MGASEEPGPAHPPLWASTAKLEGTSRRDFADTALLLARLLLFLVFDRSRVAKFAARAETVLRAVILRAVN